MDWQFCTKAPMREAKFLAFLVANDWKLKTNKDGDHTLTKGKRRIMGVNETVDMGEIHVYFFTGKSTHQIDDILAEFPCYTHGSYEFSLHVNGPILTKGWFPDAKLPPLNFDQPYQCHFCTA